MTPLETATLEKPIPAVLKVHAGFRPSGSVVGHGSHEHRVRRARHACWSGVRCAAVGTDVDTGHQSVGGIIIAGGIVNPGQGSRGRVAERARCGLVVKALAIGGHDHVAIAVIAGVDL